PFEEESLLCRRLVLDPRARHERQVRVPTVERGDAVEECTGAAGQVHAERAAAAGAQPAREHRRDELPAATVDDSVLRLRVAQLVASRREGALDAQRERPELAVQAEAAGGRRADRPDGAAGRVVDATRADETTDPRAGPRLRGLLRGPELRLRRYRGDDERRRREQDCCLHGNCYYLCCKEKQGLRSRAPRAPGLRRPRGQPPRAAARALRYRNWGDDV